MDRKNVLIMLFALSLGTCNDNQDLSHKLANHQGNHPIVSQVYHGNEPIVQIINPVNFTTVAKPFSVSNDSQRVQIYAIGEILYSLDSIEKKNYLKGDEIKLSIQNRSDPEHTSCQSKYVFGYKETKKYRSSGIEFKWTSQLSNTQYCAELKLPLSIFSCGAPLDTSQIYLQFTIGDNDNGFVQQKELGWFPDTLCLSSYGRLHFSKTNLNLRSIQACELTAYNGTPIVDGHMDDSWKFIPAVTATHTLRGKVKDIFDLSASVRAQWDDSFVYILIIVNDSRQKHIPPKKEKEREIFVDYGWIENFNNEVVWMMEAQYSKHAGGGYKNQFIDTILWLPKGKYVLRYITDESHAYNEWQVAPPSTEFYGVAVYPFTLSHH